MLTFCPRLTFFLTSTNEENHLQNKDITVIRTVSVRQKQIGQKYRSLKLMIMFLKASCLSSGATSYFHFVSIIHSLKFWMPTPLGGGQHLSMMISIFFSLTSRSISIGELFISSNFPSCKWIICILIASGNSFKLIFHYPFNNLWFQQF